MDMMRPVTTECVPYSSSFSLRQTMAAWASVSTGAAARIPIADIEPVFRAGAAAAKPRNIDVRAAEDINRKFVCADERSVKRRRSIDAKQH
jgi:hypothetical protein